MNTKKILSLFIVILLAFSCVSVSSFSADKFVENPVVVSTSDEALTSPDEKPLRRMGDADNNSVINVRDATLVRKYIADLSTLDEESLVFADVDRNEAVNIKDATNIQKYVAGMYNVFSVGFPFDTNPETYRYYFYMPSGWINEYTEQTGNIAGIYWWEGTNCYNAWPGGPAKKADMEGIYYYDVPTDVTTIIWNNYIDGGEDREQPIYTKAAQTVNIGTEYYDPGESDLYPNGTANFDGMIYVTEHEQISPCCDYSSKMQCRGEWFYYYGNGEYGTAPVRGDSKILAGDTVDLTALAEDNNPTETYRYYFYMPDEWLNDSTAQTGNTAGIYWWEGTDAQSFYPGLPAHKADAEGVYYYDVPMDVTTINWNNYFDGGNDIMSPYYADAIDTIDINLQGYKAGENPNYPGGIDNFDGMIFVTDFLKYDYNEYTGKICFYGEWFYYYGNGEYGKNEFKVDSEFYTDSMLNQSLPTPFADVQ